MGGIRSVRKKYRVGIEPSPFSGKKSVKSDTDSESMEKENRDYVSEYFLPIILEKKCGVEVFNIFVLELYNSWGELREEWLGRTTIYGVLKKPTFMGEMLARFILEEKEEAKKIDFTDKKLLLKEMVAKHYFGELWKQKMLFLELLQKLRYDGAILVIPHAVIEKFVDKTFVKSDKRAFIIKVFVEMAKNRGFKLGDIELDEQKKCDDFIARIIKEKFKKKVTESEMMKGVEGFSWNKVYRIKKAENTELQLLNHEGERVNKHMYFLRLIKLIGKKKEISVPELGKLMEQAGYAKNRRGTFSNPTVRSVIRKLKKKEIDINHKHDLCDEEMKVLMEKLSRRERVKRNEIKQLLMEHGRVLENFIGRAVQDGSKFVKQHKVGMILEGWHAGVDNYFATKLPYVIERVRGKKEITLPELGKIMEELGYAKRKSGLIYDTAAKKVMRAVEDEGIQITCKKELSAQEKELLLKYAEERKERIKYKKIRKLLMENGRVIESYVAEPAKKALEFLRQKGYNVRTAP